VPVPVAVPLVELSFLQPQASARVMQAMNSQGMSWVGLVAMRPSSC
jgi:hypothetical protein